MGIKPILFNTEMVQTLLEGRKTVTRRVIKYSCPSDQASTLDDFVGESDPQMLVSCAPYRAGDVLWVRETFSRKECTQDCAGWLDPNECPFNRVGGSCYGYKTQYIDSTEAIPWHPSIHMPKEAARLFLRVAGVRVERLREMNVNDFLREGICLLPKTYASAIDCVLAHAEKFKEIWDSTIKPAGLPRYGWAANPLVWVIEFERCEKPAGWPGEGDTWRT